MQVNLETFVFYLLEAIGHSQGIIFLTLIVFFLWVTSKTCFLEYTLSWVVSTNDVFFNYNLLLDYFEILF